MKGFCGKHQQMMGNRLKHVGLWKLVKQATPQETRERALAWLHGKANAKEMCPLVILMLELQAKANRMADGGQGTHVMTCPCCSIQRFSNDETADVKVINGLADVVLGLFQSNGLIGGTPAASLGARKEFTTASLRDIVVAGG